MKGDDTMPPRKMGSSTALDVQAKATSEENTRNRRWLSRRLRRFFWSKRMIPLLETLECGWLDGGCYTGSVGLYEYLLLSEEGDPANLSLNIIADLHCAANHVVVCLIHDGQRWYLDANGVQSEEQVLRYWEREEQLVSPWIRAYNAPLLAETGIPLHPAVSRFLTENLFAVFGRFSPAWLAS
jgi:hypothetical protein